MNIYGDEEMQDTLIYSEMLVESKDCFSCDDCDGCENYEVIGVCF